MLFITTHSKPTLLSLTIASLLSTQSAHASTQSATATDIANAQEQYNQQRQQALEKDQSSTPTVNIDSRDYQIPNVTQLEDKTDDAQCFDINNIYLSGEYSKNFYFALQPSITGKNSVLGSCLNVTDINNLATDIQNRIIDKGYVTTRVTVQNQNLKAGNLFFHVVAGLVEQVKLDPKTDVTATARPIYTDSSGNPANFASAMPIKSGDLLNIRKIEQTLENLKRVPTADANFSIAPSSERNEAGYSDILINWQQPKRWRLSASVDDSGQESTGKYQGNLTLSLDNVTWHNDILNLSLGHNLDGAFDDIDNDSWSYNLGYSLPIDYHLFNVSHNGYNYEQTVAGANQDYIYSGDSFNTSLNYSYLAHRDSHSKTYLKGGGFVKKQRNYIDDTEVEVQRRKTAGWTFGVGYETKVDNTQVSSELIYHRGTGAFNALTPPESLFNEGSARTGIIKANFDVRHPFTLDKLGGKPFEYHAMLKGQYVAESLVPADRFSIGGRYTVRGFDGKRTLSGDVGALLRQDISMPIKDTVHQLYVGFDAGYVQMASDKQDALLLGHHLLGASVGVKGQLKPLNMSYDVFSGVPVDSPKGFGEDDVVGGFSLNWQY